MSSLNSVPCGLVAKKEKIQKKIKKLEASKARIMLMHDVANKKFLIRKIDDAIRDLQHEFGRRSAFVPNFDYVRYNWLPQGKGSSNACYKKKLPGHKIPNPEMQAMDVETALRLREYQKYTAILFKIKANTRLSLEDMELLRDKYPRIQIDNDGFIVDVPQLQPQMFGITENISDLSHSLQNLSLKIDDETIKGLAEALKNVTVKHDIPTIKTQNDIGSSLFDVATKFLNRSYAPIEFNHNNIILDTLRSLKPLWPLLAIAIGVYLWKTDKVSLDTLLCFTSLFGILYFPTCVNLVRDIINRLTNRYQPQVSFDICEAFFSLFAVFNFGKDFSSSTLIKKFALHLKDYDRVKMGASSWLNDIINLLQKIINFFRVKVFGKDEWIFYLGDNDTLSQYLIECNELLVRKEANPTISHEDGVTLTTLYTRGLELQRIMTNPLDRQKLSFALSQLVPLRNKMKGGQWEGAGARIPPLVICIAGGSQIGKSTMVMSLIYRVLAEYLTGDRLDRFIENPDKEIFSYNWDREHQDGADKQSVYLFDDAGCTVDIAGEKNNMYQTIIRITNIVPMHLNMAALELKSDSLFKGEFVVLTTNRDTWGLNSLHYIPAYVKRLHLCYEASTAEGMVMPKDIDPSFAFDFIRFRKMKYCLDGIKPPTYGEEIGGYEDLVRQIVTTRFEQVRIGTELMEAAKLQIAQGLISRNEEARTRTFFEKTVLKTTKSNMNREITVNALRTLLVICLDLKQRSATDPEFHSRLYDALSEQFILDNHFCSAINELYVSVCDKIHLRYRCLSHLFPLSVEKLINYKKTYQDLALPDPIEIREDDVFSDHNSYKDCESSLIEPQILLDTNMSEPTDASNIGDAIACFIPVIGLYDYLFGMLAPIRRYVARQLRYSTPEMISLPSSYKGSLEGWTNWSAWLSARNSCDCALCSLTTFNCPAEMDVLVETNLRNGKSSSELLHFIYIQVLGALHIDNPNDREHKQMLLDLLQEAGVDATSIFNSRLGLTREKVAALEQFLIELDDDAEVPHLCLNNTLLRQYLMDKPGWGMYMIAYIRIMKEIRLLRTYGKNSFKRKLIKSTCSSVAKKIQDFRLWVSVNSTTIANMSVYSTLFLALIGPTLFRAYKNRNKEVKLLTSTPLFKCKNVTHVIKDKTCDLSISCPKCKKKFEFKFNIDDGFLVIQGTNAFIDYCRTVSVVVDNHNLPDSVDFGDIDIRFTDGMTTAVPIYWTNDDKRLDLCCNDAFSYNNLLDPTEPRSEAVVTNDGIELKKTMPSNWIPNSPCYDTVEHQIGKKIVLGNSLLVHRILEYEGEVPTEKDYKHALGDKRCSILMLGDRIGVIPNHVYSYIKCCLEKNKISKKNPIVLSMAHDPTMMPIMWVPDESQFYALGSMADKDMVIVRLPNMICKNYTHLLKYFLKRSELSNDNVRNGNLWTPKGANSFELRSSAVTTTVPGSVKYLGYDNGVSWKYKIATEAGDCGSILTISNPASGGRKIVGVHVVGSPKEILGSSIRIFYEDVETIYNYFRDLDNAPLQDSDFLDNLDPQFKCENKYHIPYRPSPYPKQPKFKSKIVPAPLHHVGKIERIPADADDRIIDGELFKPYTAALAKSVTPHVLLDHSFLNILTNYYTWFLSKRSFGLPDTSRRLTTEELISGKSDDFYIRPINRPASLGPPYKWMLTKEDPTLKGKQEAFGKDEYLYDTPLAKKILSDFDRCQKLAEEGYRVIQLFEDTAKDEVLPKEKVEKGKIRIFSVGGFVMYLQEKENFAQFSSWFMHNRIYNESGIGMNVFGEDWHKLIRYLLFDSYDNKNTEMFKALDISKFDGSQDRPVQYAWVTIKCSFFPPEERPRRFCTAENYLNSFHIDHGSIMERDGGNSSGRSGTGEDNTGVLGLDLAYAAVVLYQEILTGKLSPIIELTTTQIYSFLEDYHSHNRCCKYGDDLIMSTLPHWQYFSEFSEANLIRAFKVIGLSATSDAKGSDQYYYRRLEEVSFLKRVPKFNKRHLRYVGTLAISSVMKSVQWLKRADLAIDEYYKVLDKAIQELSLHETDEAKKLIKQILEEGRKIGYIPIATDLGILQDLCLSREDYS